MLSSIFCFFLAAYCGYCFFALIGAKEQPFTAVAIWCGVMCLTFATAAFGSYLLLSIMAVLHGIVIIFAMSIMSKIDREEKKKKASR